MQSRDIKTPKKNWESNTFNKLRKLYIFAFLGIAASILISEILVQNFLNKQINDSRVINLAGRQRMLSQKLAKEILLLRYDTTQKCRVERVNEINKSLTLWYSTHQGLMRGSDSLELPGNNSAEINKIYQDIEKPFQKIHSSTSAILNRLSDNPTIPFETFQDDVDVVLDNEPFFLSGMDSIVFLYDIQAREKVAWLKRLEIILLFFALAILVFEILFIFIPTTLEVKTVINNLQISENKTKKYAEEVSGLYNALKKSHKDLADINYALDQASVFAKADKNGKIVYVSNKFTELTGFSHQELKTHITYFVSSAIHEGDFLNKAFDIVSQGDIWHDQVKILKKNGTAVWLDMTIVPVVNSRFEFIQFIVLCSDITDKKIADDYYRKLDKKNFDEQIKEQRMRSSLILEGQEDERSRISKDIHDGIGQLLTGLKFQIEAINIADTEKAEQKLLELKDLVKRIISEVRRVSFFLTPGVLEDYGLAPAVNRFVIETRKFTTANLQFNNITGFNMRLDSRKEINLYRIIQEAVNNSIKYAEANDIKISFYHDKKKLTIIIQDDGKGFVTKDVLNLEDRSKTQGLYNMQERAMYADGKIEIYSKENEGTNIYLQTPF